MKYVGGLRAINHATRHPYFSYFSLFFRNIVMRGEWVSQQVLDRNSFKENIKLAKLEFFKYFVKLKGDQRSAMHFVFCEFEIFFAKFLSKTC